MSEHEPPPEVSQFMHRQVKSVTPDMQLDEVVQFLLSNQLSNAPVVQAGDGGNYLIGFVSERDCLAALTQEEFYGSPAPTQTVRTIMRSSPVSVPPDTDLFAVASLLIHHGYRHVPVTDEGKLLGMVSRRDVLHAVADYGKRYGQALLRERFRPDPRQIINLRFLVKGK
ncbi:MAG: CBS domain-containing protein [Pirellulaceae bacterium]|nr:CBS domain-containing protein [Pirellulaceae bacterium]